VVVTQGGLISRTPRPEVAVDSGGVAHLAFASPGTKRAHYCGQDTAGWRCLVLSDEESGSASIGVDADGLPRVVFGRSKAPLILRHATPDRVDDNCDGSLTL
jgi:hypothetical protein